MHKHIPRGDRAGRRQHQIPGLGQRDRRQALPDTLPPSRKSAHEDRHVGAQRQGQLRKGVLVETGGPKPIQRNQRGRRIGAAAPEPPAHRKQLLAADIRPETTTGRVPQRLSRADGQIVLRRDTRHVEETMDQPVLAHLEPKPIATVDELEHRLQLVITIRPTPDDAQHEIEFGGRGPKRLGGRLEPERLAHRALARRAPADRVLVHRDGSPPDARCRLITSLRYSWSGCSLAAASQTSRASSRRFMAQSTSPRCAAISPSLKFSSARLR